MSSFGLRLGVKADHLSRIEQTARIVLLLGLELNIIGAKTPTVFNIVHMRISDKNSNFTAVSDEFVQAILPGKIHQRYSAGDDHTFAIFHELDMEQNLVCRLLLEKKKQI